MAAKTAASERHAAERREQTKMVPLPSDSIVPERDVDKRPVLECRHLGIDFGGLHAVEDFNFTVGKTEIAGLIGPNGAGKTTVFNLLTKVYQPTRGSIMLDGTDMAGLDIAGAHRPCGACTPIMLATERRRISHSTMMVRRPLVAAAMARLYATVVLPSLG